MKIITSRYSNIAIILHWLTSILILFMLVFGEDYIRDAKETFGPSLHASIGISILLLSILRLVWRFRNPPPALPAGMKPWEVTLSHISHWAFYVLMIGLPLSGMMSFAQELPKNAILNGATIFELISVPSLPNIGGAGGFIHMVGTKLVWALLALHVLAALKHQFWDKDNLLKRMSPH